MGCVGAGNEGLGRDAAGIDAGSAEELALDDGYFLAGGRESCGERGASLSGTDDNGVVVGQRGRLTPPRMEVGGAGTAGKIMRL